MTKINIKKTLIITLSIIFAALFSALFIYLILLPEIIKSDFFSNNLNKIVKTALNADLEIKNPNLKTYLKPKIDFSIDSLSLQKDGEDIIKLEDFSSSVSFNKIFNKEIKLNHLIAKTLIIKADKLTELVFKEEQTQNSEIDYRIDFYKANIKLDEFELSWLQGNNTRLDVYLRDIFLECEKEYKNLSFNLEAYIFKNDKTYADIVSSVIDEVKIYDNYLEIKNLKTMINNSRLKISSKIDTKSVFINAKSDRFYLGDIFNIINSDFIIPDGQSLLAPLITPEGYVSFDVSLNNDALNGYINIKGTSAKIKDLSNIPLNMTEGKIIIDKDRISLSNLQGYWGKNKKNTIEIKGDIKDYYASFDSDIVIDTKINNEFFSDYLAPLINNTSLYLSKPSNTRIIYKAKNGIMDIVWLAKISKGINFGTDDSKSALSDLERAVKGDFHIEGDKIDIKNINYYISREMKRGQKIEPILVLSGKMDMAGNVDEIGFGFAREVPCEFLNIFTKDKTFRKGTIQGDLYIVYRDNTPCLKADMKIKKTFIPSQRLMIKEASLKTRGPLINIAAEGKFKKANYNFKGNIKNELQPPFIIKNLSLDIDDIDIEKILASMNSQNANDPAPTLEALEDGDESADDNYMFDVSMLQIEEADFSLLKGNYKDLTFGNIKAKMSLDEHGILKIKSNKFDIAEGSSALKVECDLKNLKYYIRLGVKEIDSNLMAKVLFNLDKEITGKASGIIELNSDETLRLNGDIKFLVTDGTIGKIGLVEYLLKVASVFRNPVVMISPATIMDIISIPEGKFDKISGELKMKDNVVEKINIKSYSDSLSALIKGRFDMERHDASLRVYTRFSSNRKSVFSFLRNISLNSLANKVKMNTKNDANYYEAELNELPQINVDEDKAQVFLTQVEGDVENNNFLSSLKKIK